MLPISGWGTQTAKALLLRRLPGLWLLQRQQCPLDLLAKRATEKIDGHNFLETLTQTRDLRRMLLK